MNPLSQVKSTQRITSRETALGISERGSWHEKYKESAYINAGLLPFELTEGDLLAIFAQYGEIVDVNLVRDKATGKSRGFAFLAYEDQRSTVLAVDNLNGANVLGRTIRVDHVANYKKKIEEDEGEEQRKREERGVCYAFQRGECTRGDACKFSHNLERNGNTGWGKKDDGPTWDRRRDRRSPAPTFSRTGSSDPKDIPPALRRQSSTMNERDRSVAMSSSPRRARDREMRMEERASRSRYDGPGDAPSSMRERQSVGVDQRGSSIRRDGSSPDQHNERRYGGSPRSRTYEQSRDGIDRTERMERRSEASPRRHMKRSEERSADESPPRRRRERSRDRMDSRR